MTDIDILKAELKGEALEKALKEYKNGKPCAYILGKWEFFGLPFKVNENCLIPRCDTERVVEKAIKLIPRNSTFADICTGSGAIGISVLKHRPDLYCIAVDISKEALENAEINAKTNGVSGRIKFINADIFNPCFLKELPFVSCVVSNPPYITENAMKTLDEYVKKEPEIALYGGVDGLDFYKYMSKHLKEKTNLFIYEIGYNQGEEIKKIAKENNSSCEVSKDYSGNDRVAVLKYPE